MKLLFYILNFFYLRSWKVRKFQHAIHVESLLKRERIKVRIWKYMFWGKSNHQKKVVIMRTRKPFLDKYLQNIQIKEEINTNK